MDADKKNNASFKRELKNAYSADIENQKQEVYMEVLPCPFCGGRPIPDKSLRDGCKDGELEAYAHFVRCESCAAQGPWTKNLGGAMRRWNIRQDGAGVSAKE